MIPFRFGSPDHRLFAAYHPPHQSQTPRQAVLLCNPFGQESVRLHRFYKVLADRLARAGMAVMRFDYFGTGDSDGNDMDGHLDIWRSDILLAHDELQRRSACNNISWIGARLGASLAIQAATQPQLERLILWDPILDGTHYLQQLAQDHISSIARVGRATIQTAAKQPRGEALGFGMSERLIAQIDQIRPDRLFQPTRANSITVLSADTPAINGSHTLITHRTLDVPFDWTSEEALNTSLVPPVALKAITGVIEGASA